MAYERAVKAGVVSLRVPEDRFYGDHTAGVKDSNGVQWWLATHIENVSLQEMHCRVEALQE